MFSWLFPSRPAPKARPSARPSLEALEDRLTPTVTFNPASGVLLLRADPSSTYEYVNITPSGAKSDGSTGVNVFSSLTNYQTETFGDADHPVRHILLDLKNGQDTDNVQIASLAATDISVGAGNGNNFIQIGDARLIVVVAGTGYNNIQTGSPAAVGSPFGFNEEIFLGYTYNVDTTFGLISPGVFVGNDQGNYVKTADQAGTFNLIQVGGQSLVNNGSGANIINTGNGDDTISVLGNGSNYVNAGNGLHHIFVVGNGNNKVNANGLGEIHVTGNGSNYVNAGTDPDNFVFLDDRTGFSYVAAAMGASVDINNTLVTATGFYGPVYVQFF